MDFYVALGARPVTLYSMHVGNCLHYQEIGAKQSVKLACCVRKQRLW